MSPISLMSLRGRDKPCPQARSSWLWSAGSSGCVRASQHQLQVGKATMNCYLWRTYMSPGVALGSLCDSCTPPGRDLHAFLFFPPRLPISHPLGSCSCFWPPSSIQLQILSPLPQASDARWVFPLPFWGCPSPMGVVTTWRGAGDTGAVVSLPCRPAPAQSALPLATCFKGPVSDTRVYHALAGKSDLLSQSSQ